MERTDHQRYCQYHRHYGIIFAYNLLSLDDRRAVTEITFPYKIRYVYTHRVVGYPNLFYQPHMYLNTITLIRTTSAGSLHGQQISLSFRSFVRYRPIDLNISCIAFFVVLSPFRTNLSPRQCTLSRDVLIRVHCDPTVTPTLTCVTHAWCIRFLAKYLLVHFVERRILFRFIRTYDMLLKLFCSLVIPNQQMNKYFNKYEI